jgi:hypothetical protein
MNNRTKEVVHPNPVWRDRADFIVGARVREGGDTEQLWARRLGEQRFQICCIPFFLYDVALGDVVETDQAYDFVRVVEESGRHVFRVWFGDSAYPRDEIADSLTRQGALLEWSSVNLLAVDAVDLEQARVLARYLAEHEAAGHLTRETGRTA